MSYLMTIKGLQCHESFSVSMAMMGQLRRAMRKLGMLSSECVQPYFPPAPNDWYLLKNSDTEEGITQEQRNTYDAYQKIHEQMLAWRGDCQVIPWHKLVSHDGWMVSSQECDAALEKWHAQPTEQKYVTIEAIFFWNDWIRFLERASANNGFVVT